MSGLYRSRRYRIVAGVCGGIAEKMGWDPWMVRLGWLILSTLPGPLWVVYVLLWVLLPEDPIS